MKRQYRLAAQELAAYEAANLAAAESAGEDWVPPAPRPAAGVILARDVEGGPEVLLVRRRSDVGFAAGAFVFPGGTLDEADGDLRWSNWLDAPTPKAVAGAQDSGGASAQAFVVAALRELFEETGVLLASGLDQATGRLDSARASLVAGEANFLEIVEHLGLRLSAQRMVLVARWVTPEALPRRYDARFFLAPSPPRVEVAPEAGELVEHVWVAPEDALARYVEEEFPLMFPTAVTLGWLEEGGSLEEWRRRFTASETESILPRLRRVDGEVRSVLPDDPHYGD